MLIFGICAALVLVGYSVYSFIKPDFGARPMAYQIGTVKEKLKAYKNTYPNVVHQDEGFWTMRDGCRIHYRVDGKGVPVLIIHGGPGEPYKKPWEGLKLINSNYSFVYYDQRGCGQSTRPIDQFTTDDWRICQPQLFKELGIETCLMDIEEIRQILGDEKITIIGHSYGAVIASLYAIEFPDNVDKLILVSPAPSIRFPIASEDDIDAIIEKELSAQTKEAFNLYEKDLWNPAHILKMNEKELSAQNSYFFHFYDEYHINIGLPKSVTLIDKLVDKDNIGGWLPYAYAWSFPSQFDYRNNLKTIKAPTLIVWGDHDICKEAWILEYSSNIPDSSVVQIQNVGHFMYEENPVDFSLAVQKFLSK